MSSKRLESRISRVATKVAGWEKLPRGWSMRSAKKFWSTMTGDTRHKTSKCIRKMKGKIDNPEAFCSSLHDLVAGSTKWRSEWRKKKKRAACNVC